MFKLPDKLGSICTISQIHAAVAVSLGSLVVGYCSAWSSPAIPSLQANTTTLSIDNGQASWIGSLMPLAALLGGILGGSALEKFGRKTTILGTAIPFIVAGVMVGIAGDVNMIYAGRAITGFCIGIISLSLPVYLAESTQPEVRGTLGMLPTTLGNLGVMICYILGAWLDWSQLALVSATLPIPFLAIMFTVPETPRFLMSKGEDGKARAALNWLRKDNIQVESEMIAMRKTQSVSERSLETGWLTRQDLRPLGVCLGLMFFQQFSGINAVMFYSVSIFKDSGVVNIISTLISNLLIDKLGRKILLYLSASGMMLSLGLLGSHYFLLNYAVTFAYTPLVALVTYITSFSLGFGPIPWLLMGEVLPARSRGFGASIATSANWASTFLVTKTFLDLRDMLGAAGVFWLFGCVCCLAVVFILFCVPETRGISLEDIEDIFNTGGGAVLVCEDDNIADSKTNARSTASLKPTPSQLL